MSGHWGLQPLEEAAAAAGEPFESSASLTGTATIAVGWYIVAPEVERAAAVQAQATIVGAGSVLSPGEWDSDGQVQAAASISAHGVVVPAYVPSGYYVRGYAGYVASVAAVPVERTFPQLVVEIDFVTDPNPRLDVMPDPVWSDVTADLRLGGFTIRRGRSRSVDRVEAGSCSMTLDNRERQFDPNYVDGPYYPNVLPNRRVRVQTIAESGVDAFQVGSSSVGETDALGGGDVLVGLFDGYITSWNQQFPASGADAVVDISASDMFTLMAEDQLGYTWSTSVSSFAEGMNRVLNTRAYLQREAPQTSDITGELLGLPSVHRDIEDEEFDLRIWEDDEVTVLAACQSMESSGGGLFFIAGDGRITYRSSRTPDTMPLHLSIYQADDFSDVEFSYDDSEIANQVFVTYSPDGSTAYAQDAASMARYGVRKKEISAEFLAENATQAAVRAQTELDRYKAPRNYARAFTMHNTITDWDAVLATDLWDIVQIRVPLPNGDTYEQMSLVEGVEISSGFARDWSVTWQLSVATPYPNLLTAQQSSLEDGTTTGWVADENCTIWASTRYPREGSYALLVYPTEDGDAVAATDPVAGVVAGNSYRAQAWLYGQLFLLGGSGSAHLKVEWLDSGLLPISTTTGTSVGISRGMRLSVDGVAPTGTAYAALYVVWEDAPGLGEPATHPDDYPLARGVWVDDVSLRRTL